MARLSILIIGIGLPLSACFSLLQPQLRPAVSSSFTSSSCPQHRISSLNFRALPIDSKRARTLRSPIERGQATSGTKDEDTIEFDEVDLQNMKVAQLKDLCKSVGVPTSGKKGDLIARLMEVAGSQASSDDSASPPIANSGATTLASDPFGAADDDTEPSTPPPSSQAGAAAAGPGAAAAAAAGFPTGPDGTWNDSNDMLIEGRYRLFTQPRTGNCWHGLFFDIESLGPAVTITGIRTASAPEHQGPLREDKLNVNLYTCDGTAVGKERTPDAWRPIGAVRAVQLPTVVYGESEAFFGPLPLREPVRIPAGGTAGFCVFTTSWRGVVLRAKLGSKFEPGEVTDSDSNIRLKAGLLPKNDKFFEDTMFTEVYSDDVADAFVGIIEYNID